MPVRFSNNISTTLATGITSSDTTIQLASTTGLPTLATSSDYFYLTIDTDTASNPTREVIKVTAVNTGTNELTVVRAQDSTSAASFNSGTKVELRVNAGVLNDVVDTAQVEASATAVALAIALG